VKVRILTQVAKLLEEEAREVVFPGEDGEFSAMDFHQPCLYSLRPGQIKVFSKNSKKIRRVLIRKGVVSIEPLKVTALVEAIETR
jgi:F0F1-type ATP synthase epsilon subunit